MLVIRRTTLSHDGRALEYTEIEAPADRFEAAATTDPGTETPGPVVLRV